MLSSLTLKNFKPFENQSFYLKPLTLLAGLNSTGKSSLLQSLLLLRQSFQQNLLDNVGLALNGDLVSIGTAKDALFKRAKEDSITLEIVMNNKIKGTWVFDYDRQSDVMQISSLSNANVEIYNSSLFTDKFHYLKAERIAPRNYFQMSDFQVKQHQQIGSQGEFTAHFLSINEYAKIPHHQLSHPSAQSDSLKSQVEAWLGEISPGTRIDIGLHSAMDLVNLQCSYEDNNKKLDADKVQINYFERYLKKGQPTTDIITPRIYPDGGIDKWPDGFFDQAEKDLMELL